MLSLRRRRHFMPSLAGAAKPALGVVLAAVLLLFTACADKTRPAARLDDPDSVTPDTVLPYCLNVVQELQQLRPDSPEAYSAMGYVYYRAKKYEDAVQAFQKSLSFNPNQPVIVQMTAFIYNRLADYEKAVEWYQKTVELDPDAERANERLGLALQRLNRMDEAMKAFEQEIRFHPGDASARIYLGERYFAAGRLEDAEEQARKAMQAEEILPEPYYLLGRIYRKQGLTDKSREMLEIFRAKKDEEQEYIEEAIVEKSDQGGAADAAARTHLDVGTIYYNYRLADKAVEHFQRALRFDPGSVEARLNLVMIYQSKNQFDRAEAQYQELFNLHPGDSEFLLSLGVHQFGQKQYAGALPFVERALQLDPDNLTAKRLLARILLALDRRPDKALQILKSIPPGQLHALDYDLLSWAYYANGDAAQCLESIRKAMSIEPDNPMFRKRYETLLSKMRPSR